MVNALKWNFSPLLVGTYPKSTKWSTWGRHQANDGKSGLEAEIVRAVGAMCSLWSRKKLAAEKWQETHFISNDEKEKWIKYYVERGTAVPRKRVDDAEAAIGLKQEDKGTAQIVELTTREPKERFEEMMVAIGDSLSNLASINDGEDGEDADEEETKQGNPSEDDKPGWVMGTISNTVQQHMERFRQQQMNLEKLTQLGWGDAADYFCERDKKYGRSGLIVPAVDKPHTDVDADALARTTFGVLMACLDIVRGI